jgi:predicted nucleotide-binding protein
MTTYLRMTVPAACDAIDAQIAKAEPWLTATFSEEQLTDTKNVYYRWIDYNELLLTRMFSDDSIQKEYQNSTRHFIAVISGRTTLGDNIKDFHDDVKSHINALQSVKERLGLFEHVPESNPPTPIPVTATVEQRQNRIGEKKIKSNKVFVVHGHDDAAKLEVQQLLGRLKFEPIILNQQANKGRTIIEKFTDHAATTVFAVVLLTPDDEGYSKKDGPAKKKDRARQNVVLELGFFLSELGRGKVCALCKGDIEIPSDYDGVIYTRMDAGGAWKTELAKEMKAAGLPVDMNDL